MDEASLHALTEATAGAVGGLLSTTLLYPLDTCKTKFQAEAEAQGRQRYRNLFDVLHEAVSSGRVLSLYQGLPTKNVHSVLTGFVYFYSYSFIRSRYLAATAADQLGLLANLAVAASAGACTALVAQPWDTLSARMQTSRPGECKGFLAMLREGGLRQAYDGMGVSLMLTCNPAIQYTVFEQLKTRLLQWNSSSSASKGSKSARASAPPAVLSAAAAFLLGALSKTIATVLTYPAIRCKVLMQRAETAEERRRREDGDGSAGPPKSMILAMRLIWLREGLFGFYKGLDAQILKTVVAAALMLMIKEKVAAGSRAMVLAAQGLVAAVARRPATSTTSTAAAAAAARFKSADAAAKLAAASSPAALSSSVIAVRPLRTAAATAATAPATVTAAHSHLAPRPHSHHPSHARVHTHTHTLLPAALPPPTSALHTAAAASLSPALSVAAADVMMRARPIGLEHSGAGMGRTSRLAGNRGGGLVYRGVVGESAGMVAEL